MKPGTIEAIRLWHQRVITLEAEVEALDRVVGCSPESPLSVATYAALEAYTDAVQDAHGLGTWLNWWWSECGLGKTPLGASIGGAPLREIATVEDLIRLCEEWVDCETSDASI